MTETTGSPRSRRSDRALERRPRLVPVLVVVRQRKPPPVRLADDDVAARPHSRRERLDGVGEAAVDEARAEAERSVVGLRLVRRGRTRRRARRSRDRASPASAIALDRDRVEVRRDLDPVPRAAELGGEQRAPARHAPTRCRARATRARARDAARGGGASPPTSGSGSRAPPRRRRSSGESRAHHLASRGGGAARPNRGQLGHRAGPVRGCRSSAGSRPGSSGGTSASRFS